MEIPEDYERSARVPGDDKRKRLEEFVAWHPLESNANQVSLPFDKLVLPADLNDVADVEMGYPF